LQLEVFDTKGELGQAAARDAAMIINQAISERGAAYVIAATGASQFEFLDSLVVEEIDWSKVVFFHLDEYVGLPESHAASFALIAYSSAYLKCHYLPAFTAAMLNNQPMGFYHPATLVKDAQRHGLRVRPIDVTQSDWRCTLERIDGQLVMRLGLRYVKGLREDAGREIERQRKLQMFRSIDDLKLRVPALQKSELMATASQRSAGVTGLAS